ncbi:hypothetical protein SEVIR_1G013000v4 [Setaria viridis]|uniref:Uncharacterized protein n=1 Tax=Setaria viridis TaxID=4556 RepID=A0A4U6W5J6_SETVI|nr:uncharacterized protein LOC117861902 [Setaria viridis]TKW36914.1 hypothetical protein SEVIR_1G013000v2 [Setaria viridis]
MITKPATLHQIRQATTPSPAAGRMPWFPAVPPALAAADGGRIKKQRAGLPKLLHKLFIKVLRLRPSSAAEEFYGYRMGGGGSGEEYCYYYSYGGAGSSWAGVLSSIPEEDDSSEEGTPDVAPGPAVLRKAQSERFVVGPPDAATVVHVEVLL